MPEQKRYIKRIKLPNETTPRYLYDEEAIHEDEIDSYLADYLPLTGGNVTGDVSITGTLSASTISLGDIPEMTTPVSNVLTKDTEDNNKLKYHSTDEFLREIGGIGVVSVENNVLTYTVGTTTN